MFRKPIATGAPLSAAARASMIDTLFNQQGAVVAGLIMSIALALFCWSFSHEPALLAFACASTVINGLRIWSCAFYARRDAAARSRWGVRWYFVGATANALAWGSISAFVFLFSTPLEQMAVFGGVLAYAAASAVRNSAMPTVVFFQIVPPFLMSVAACLVTRMPFYTAYSVFILVDLLILAQMMRSLSRKTRALLIAEEKAAVAIESLARANQLLEAKTVTDALTGAVNRRGFDLALIRECRRAKREHQPLSLLMLDLDHFKSLNDTLGHQAGDECLRTLARCLEQAVRGSSDIVARYGGEEFAIILPNTNSTDAAMMAERMRAMVQALGVPNPKNVFGVATASIGHATLEDDVDGGKLLKLADEALYRAKMSGRNQIRGSRKSEEKKLSIRPPLLALAIRDDLERIDA